MSLPARKFMKKKKRLSVHFNPCHDERGRFCSTGGGGLSESTKKYIEEWSWGRPGVPANTMPAPPSDDIIRELGNYLPGGKVVLYRGQRYGVARNEIESWTTDKGMAEFIVETQKQQGVPSYVTKMAATKKDMLSFNPLLPKQWDMLESEVIVVRGQIKQRVNRIRKNLTTQSLTTHARPLDRYPNIHVRTQRSDPTKTTDLREAFERQMRVRFNKLKTAIRTAVIDRDCFGLTNPAGFRVFFNPCHDAQGKFCSTGGGSRQVSHITASSSAAATLNREWSQVHGQHEGPFWNVEGENSGRYYTNRDENNKLIAGATTVRKGMSTEILSIASHAQAAGVDILNQIKSENVFLIALASSAASKAWFIRNGFREVHDKPGQYNVKWRRPNQTLKAYANPELPTFRAFDFPTTQAKKEAFLKWLKKQEELGILETMRIPQFGQATEAAWTDVFVKDSYARGVQRARYEMGKAGYPVPALEGTGGIVASMSLPFHVERCFISPHVKIFTSRGWKSIGKVQVDDLVLTDKGRFRKVTKTIRTPKQLPEVVQLETGKYQRHITATVGHPMMVNGQWTPIEQVKVGDKLSYLAAKCKTCGELIPYDKQFCNRACSDIFNKESISQKVKQKWQDPEYRNKTKRAMKESFENGVRDKFETTKAANDSTRNKAKNGIPIGFQLSFQDQVKKDEIQRLAHEGRIKKGPCGFQVKENRDKALSISLSVIKLMLEQGYHPFKCKQVQDKAITKARVVSKKLVAQGQCGFQRADIREKSYNARWTPELRKRQSDYLKANCPMKRPEIAAKQSKSMTKFYYQNPDKHPRRTVAQSGHITGIERKVKQCLDELGLIYEQEFPIKIELQNEYNRVYYVDFAIPELGLVIECDGSYWHTDQEKDRIRQERIEALGWYMLRFSEQEINEQLHQVKNELNRIACNHSGMYEFVDMQVTEVIRRKVKTPRMLFNLSVEEDESYLANGFIVHNCGVAFSRAFDGLRGITEAMNMQISHILAQGLVDGDNPIPLAKKLIATIDGVNGQSLGITDSLGRYIPAERRARMLARTEIIRAHAWGSLQEYKMWSVAGVDVEAEWVTAGFNVCPQCQDKARKGPYTIEEAMNMIPWHPNCRCAWLPRPVEKRKQP